MIALKDLEAYLWGAANLLRGMIDAADFKQYIFPMLFYILQTVKNFTFFEVLEKLLSVSRDNVLYTLKKPECPI